MITDLFAKRPACSIHLELKSQISSSGYVPNAAMLVSMLIASGALNLAERDGRSDSESFACLVEPT